MRSLGLYLSLFLATLAFGSSSKTTAKDLKIFSTKTPKKGLKDCVCPSPVPNPKPIDCDEVRLNGFTKSGIYEIWPRSRTLGCTSFKVYCDLESDREVGWTVIQRRGNFGNPKNFFSKDWIQYRNGFGLLDQDFWLGNEKISALTNQASYSVRFDMQHINGTSAYAMYDTFWIDDEIRSYRLHIAEYSGTAGDSMDYHNLMPFTTRDRENSPSNLRCGRDWTGGWWFRDCHKSNLNGMGEKGRYECKVANGIEWYSFSRHCTSLVATEIKIRPAATS